MTTMHTASTRTSRSRRIAAVAAGLLTATAVAGVAHADPDGSQRLRGLEGRIFLVDVKPVDDPDGPTVFSNCYRFEEEGAWTDDAVPAIPFRYEQGRTGASTGYTVFLPGGDVVFQTGHVGPAGGAGVLQLRAATPVTPLGPLYSFGHEVDECPEGIPNLPG